MVMKHIVMLCLMLLAACSISEDGDTTVIDSEEKAPPIQAQAPPAPSCGDGSCDGQENSCTCSLDCGSCAKSINERSAYACVENQCVMVNTTVLCGDAVCHPSEQGKCAIDCPTCADKDACTRDFFSDKDRNCVHEPITPCCGNKNCEVGEADSCIDDCGSLYDLSDYPRPFLSEGQLNALIIVGEGSGSRGVLAGVNVVQGLGFSGSKPGYTTESRLDTEVDSIDNKNAILIGNACHNKFVQKLWKKTPEACTEGLKTGEQAIKLFKTGATTYAIAVMGFSPDDVRSASEYLLKPNETQMTGVEFRR